MVRDEHGIGAFLVELGAPDGALAASHMLSQADIGRLRATKAIVAERARAIFSVAT